VEAETEIDRGFFHPNKTEDLKIILHILTQRQIGHKVLVREVGEVHPTLTEISLLEEAVQMAEEDSLLEEEEEVQVAEEDSHQEEIEEDSEEVDEIVAIFQIPVAVIFILQW